MHVLPIVFVEIQGLVDASMILRAGTCFIHRDMTVADGVEIIIEDTGELLLL